MQKRSEAERRFTTSPVASFDKDRHRVTRSAPKEGKLKSYAISFAAKIANF